VGQISDRSDNLGKSDYRTFKTVKNVGHVLDVGYIRWLTF